MGIINQGILGGISGKVGNVVGASWKGINYIRVKPASVANPRTSGQVNQRNKFSAVLEFLQPILGFIQVGYKFLANKKTAFNAAMSYVLNNAIIGTEPDFEVDYAMASVARGNLTGVQNGTVDLTTPGQVDFGWDDNTVEGNAMANDKAMLLVYNPAKKESVYNTAGADRSVGVDSLSIPASYAGDTLELFMAFISYDGTKISNSSYLGSGTAN